jgi:hypothetical protein
MTAKPATDEFHPRRILLRQTPISAAVKRLRISWQFESQVRHDGLRLRFGLSACVQLRVAVTIATHGGPKTRRRRDLRLGSAQVSRPRRSSDRRSPSEWNDLPSNKVYPSRAARTARCSRGASYPKEASRVSQRGAARHCLPPPKPTWAQHEIGIGISRNCAPHARSRATGAFRGRHGSLAKVLIRDSLARRSLR